MLKALKQVRTAASLLNPERVRHIVDRPVTIGLSAADGRGYAEMEDFLVPAQVAHDNRSQLMDRMFRAGDPGAPEQFDLLLCQEGLPCPRGGFVFHPSAPDQTIAEILAADDELSLPLARRFLAFRKPVVDRLIHSVARENAMFALATALPNIVPNLLELPWAVGEFASDTAFLTMNQVRMAFLVAAACGRDLGYAEQKAEILSIAAGAFGWRAIARELAGKIPMGGGLIPKGIIAWAGTYVIGKGLEHFNHVNKMPTRTERDAMYHDAYRRGRVVVEGLQKEIS